ncbi:MAG TPA: DUF480 domain-containing protein [Steroidobacteraceae bacterium]|nr:DUF480 domain-containing protein [Steroidobacteraceae bacterium]
MSLKTVLTAGEARVIACLIEKQITTPDQYPLSLNALTNACNQKSNRDPVLALTETEVQQLIDTLVRKHVVMERSGFGSRVPKYQHCFCNTEFSALKFTPQELAIVCELLLRGPQTPGELRSRAARMAAITDSAEVEQALEALAARAEGAVVQRLPRQAGRREARYAQLLTGALSEELTSAAEAPQPGTPRHEVGLEGRFERLEEELRQLRAEVAELRGQLISST